MISSRPLRKRMGLVYGTTSTKIQNTVVFSTKQWPVIPIFQGLCSLVDVGGGTGTVARIISEAFPHIKCTVFDLPHVVADLPETTNLKYVGGDMFRSIPSADAILIKVCNIFLSLQDYSMHTSPLYTQIQMNL
jgi:hypothetical protein